MDILNITLGFANIIIGLIMIVLSIPLKKGLIKMNVFYGVRIPKSFDSEENWYKINKYGANRLILWAFPIIVIGLIAFFIPFNENEVFLWIFSLAPLIVLIPTVEIILYARKI